MFIFLYLFTLIYILYTTDFKILKIDLFIYLYLLLALICCIVIDYQIISMFMLYSN